ncbi:relaxase domain-containing protein [Pseudonocardia hispaniensis]|uniref:Relaxase domain-containing protein n=1 Tax=Pseudonocardia hispaniensis TaxID=904933 RepID=A0ABW1IZT6_9PSEU
MAWAPHGRGPRQPGGDQRDRARGHDDQSGVPRGARRTWVTLDAETGEVAELTAYAGAFSARAKQIEANIDTYEAKWRADQSGKEPGPALRQAWDRRAWADARPDKVVPTSGRQLQQRWVDELHELGYVAPAPGAPLGRLRTGAVDRDGLVDLALVRLGSRHSAWNAANTRVRSSGSSPPAEAWSTGPCAVS